jgi:hypothetical protein
LVVFVNAVERGGVLLFAIGTKLGVGLLLLALGHGT